MKSSNKKTLENSKKSFNFNEKITTVSLAEYLTLLYSDKFIYQNEHMYYFNGVYWESEYKADLIKLNIFLGKVKIIN